MKVCLTIFCLLVSLTVLSLADDTQSLSEGDSLSRNLRSPPGQRVKQQIKKNPVLKGEKSKKKNLTNQRKPENKRNLNNPKKSVKKVELGNKRNQPNPNSKKSVKKAEQARGQNKKPLNNIGKSGNGNGKNEKMKFKQAIGKAKNMQEKNKSQKEKSGKENLKQKGKDVKDVKKEFRQKIKDCMDKKGLSKKDCESKYERRMEKELKGLEKKKKTLGKQTKAKMNTETEKASLDGTGKLFCPDCPVCATAMEGLTMKFNREVINSDLCPVCPSCPVGGDIVTNPVLCPECPENGECPPDPSCPNPGPPQPAGGCMGAVFTAMKLIKDRVQNFDKVVARTDNQIGIAIKKANKSDIFQAAADTIIAIGGGNSSSLKCANQTGTDGAKTLATLVTNLTACNESIQMACAMDFPMLDMTFVENCKNITMTFKEAVEECSTGKKQTDCNCWESEKLMMLTDMVRGCSVSGKEIKDAYFVCKDTFGACRVAEDMAVTAIAACSVDPTALKVKAQNLARNNASLVNALTKLNSLISSNATYRVRRQSDGAYISTCADLITNVTYLLTLDTDSYQVSQTANVIANADVTASDCSSTYRQTSQLIQLTTLTVSVTVYQVTVSSDLTTTQSLLLSATGSTVSADDVPTATTVAARFRDKRKYQNFHAMANHRNRGQKYF